MKKLSPLHQSLALSLSLHAGVFGGIIALDEFSGNTNLSVPHDDSTHTNITTPAAPLTQREAIMNMYGAEMFIPLEGEINEDSANRFKRDFQNANQGFANDYYVTVSTNSGGGLVHSGYEIAHEINASPIPTRILCTRQAASMAAMILITTANVFTRDATHECSLMLHAPYDRFEIGDQTINLKISDYALALDIASEHPDLPYLGVPYSFINDNGLYDVAYLDLPVEQAARNREKLETLSAAFARSIAENSNLTEEDVALIFEKGDAYFNAFEARFLGLIDHIEGAEMDEINAIVSEASVCTNHPEISLCSQEPAPTPVSQF